ncbi:chaperonin cofactor prefoldin [Dysgonomonas sp. PFB1-18]|uniref:hypothetical protein n=1 Tax=unclassified Dysgonomonas TaxID=2630389 RepID=UPI00247514CF|nr:MULTISPECIES: hypothetical protein [unclassified Dysgonomonas]MDH6310726.1 chaperonin cofactor prefoldin [Dysgonomonas sp. PF1-14]MDH6340576.1 chaperonin cofactor prefoldin [Dysgonomonas sp. PF1-16]MDH6382167.1 chaperonin cofactor prefoldin [Dysgonomonas sp. PFB1-18]MDH6399511.1 chaperonin cofactor prefoldin [Dysgonomonas sp. PF1-23]
MAKSVLNESIWEKISEIDGKINKVLGNLSSVKNEDIIAAIEEYAESNKSHFATNRKEMDILNKGVSEIKEMIENIQAPPLNPTDSGFMKARKAYLIFAILGILIFILTIFSMKLYSDSLIYQNNYYRQSTIVRELQTENDSLKVKIVSVVDKRKRK